MATYKLIQDIEAEDHILGPLTLRQFIFALIAIFCLYICFIGITKHIYFLLIPFVPPAIFFGFFAVPFGRDQPTEVWFLAKLRFWFKPRRRVWDQSGVKELVTVTAPKTVERVLTDGLSQNEVRSRLNALANTLDTRGWAIKNVGLTAYSQPNPMMAIPSDRLIDINNIPQEVPSYDVQASDDILDESNNPIAQQFDHMITESAQARRQHAIEAMNNTQPSQSQAPAPAALPANYWFMNQPAGVPGATADQVVFDGSQVLQPGIAPQAGSTPTPEEAALSAQLKQAQTIAPKASNEHIKTIQPLGSQPAQPPMPAAPVAPPPSVSAPATPSPAAPDPAILSLANNNDLNVATIARQASKGKDDDLPQEEVVISLH